MSNDQTTGFIYSVQPAAPRTLIALSPRELASVLAGLRALQSDQTGRFCDIATDAGEFDAMGGVEISDLVEQIQFGEQPVVRVVLRTDGGVLNEAFADAPFQLVVLDLDTEGGEETEIMSVEGEDVYVSAFGSAGLREAGDTSLVDAGRVESVFVEIQAHGEGESASADDGDALQADGGDGERSDQAGSPLALLHSCPTVDRLLEAVQRALAHIADPDVRQDVLDRLEPFSRGVAAAFYSRDEMAQQAPNDVEVSDAEADAALQQLVRNFEHPWDAFSAQFGPDVWERARGVVAANRGREG